MSEWTEASNAVRAAIQLEQNGIRFYSIAAEAAEDPRQKRAFLALARDEIEHLRKLQAQMASLEGSSKWLSLGALMVAGKVNIDLERLFPDDDEASSAKRAKPTDADIDNMRMAAKLEEDNYIFYAKATDDAEDPNAEAVFGYLADQEANHLQFVNTTLDAIERSHDWLQEPEETYGR